MDRRNRSQDDAHHGGLGCQSTTLNTQPPRLTLALSRISHSFCRARDKIPLAPRETPVRWGSLGVGGLAGWRTTRILHRATDCEGGVVVLERLTLGGQLCRNGPCYPAIWGFHVTDRETVVSGSDRQ